MVENIVFDVGDVLIDYKWDKMLVDYGVEEKNTRQLGEFMFGHAAWHMMDKGERSFDEVRTILTREKPEFANAINQLLDNADDMPVARPKVWNKVRELKYKGYRLFILSNYSNRLFEAHTKDIEVISLFDGIVVSYRLGLLKPDVKIYQHLLQEYKLEAEKTVFFDDKKENAQGACKVGIRGIWTPTQDSLIKAIDSIEEV